MKQAKIFYFTLQDEQTKAEKLAWFKQTKFEEISFDQITPDQKANWINLTDNDFDSLLPLLSKEVKLKRSAEAIFYFFSLGVKTDRDAWVYDFSKTDLTKKVNYMVGAFEAVRHGKGLEDLDVKWDRNLDRYIKNGIKKEFSEDLIKDSLYRPFVKIKIYYDFHFNKETHQIPSIFPSKVNESLMICFTDAGSQKEFMTIAIRNIPDFHLVGAAASTQCLPLYRYDTNGDRIDNVTDWSLTQFQTHYNDLTITKQDIFHYVYAVLHHPAYRTKYKLNLKREFPRIPFYDQFQQWAGWGKQLMDLHINFEEAEPYELERIGEGMADESHLAMQASLFEDGSNNGQSSHPTKKAAPKCKLKADKIAGTIELDTVTTLKGIPAIAWGYKLGNRSALEWILDQYKEKKPKDPTIAKLFNTYRFADYKEHVIDLLQRVCTVSVQTMAIIQQMPNAS